VPPTLLQQTGPARSYPSVRRCRGMSIPAWVALAICAAIFIVRGPIRAADPAVNMDSPLLLAAATTWRLGGNPYDRTSVSATLGEHARWVSTTLQRGQQAFVYSPPVYALLSPLTYLPWPEQRWAWNLLNVAMFVESLVLVCTIFDIRLRSAEGFAVIGIGLATNPGHICIALGQTGVATLFFMCTSWSLVPGDREYIAHLRLALGALALAIALAIKPQIALVFMVIDVFCRPRRPVALLAMCIAMASILATLALHGHAVSILQSWLENMHALMHVDADPLHGSLPHQLINLQSPLAVLTGNRMISTALAVTTGVLMALTYASIDAQAGAREGKIRNGNSRWLNALAAATIVMLLIFYHRIYDAVFLIVPAAFAVRLIQRGERRGWMLLCSLIPLWIPLYSMLYRLLERSGGLVTGPLVQAFLVQNQTWFLVAAFLVLCLARRDGRVPMLRRVNDAGPVSIGP